MFKLVIDRDSNIFKPFQARQFHFIYVKRGGFNN